MIAQIFPKFRVSRNSVVTEVFHAEHGQGLPRHDHTYSHVTFCFSGSIIIRKEHVELIMTKNTQPVELKANEWHEIEALEDGTVFSNVY